MNNDPTASSAAHEPTNDSDAQDAVDETTQDTNRRRRRGTRSSSITRRAKAGFAKKLQFMTHLMISLDMLVFAELCVLYYMDCSFFRLIIRSICQYVYLTPKPEELLLLLPSHHRFAPPVLAIIVPNVICILLHIICALPEGGEATRGYLHGGIIIDFIGQKAPTSKLSLLFLDCVVLALQCFMIAVWVERDRLRKIVLPPRTNRSRTQDTQETESTAETTGQDLDSEERGVLRDAPRTGDETNDIEMRPLTERNDSNEPGDQDDQEKEESRALMGNSTPIGSPSLIDVLRSGNAVLADFHVLHALRTSSVDYQNTAAYSLQLTGYTATLAALAAERRAREARRQQQ